MAEKGQLLSESNSNFCRLSNKLAEVPLMEWGKPREERLESVEGEARAHVGASSLPFSC